MLTLFLIITAMLAMVLALAVHRVARSPAGQLLAALFGSWADRCRHEPEWSRER